MAGVVTFIVFTVFIVIVMAWALWMTPGGGSYSTRRGRSIEKNKIIASLLIASFVAAAVVLLTGRYPGDFMGVGDP